MSTSTDPIHFLINSFLKALVIAMFGAKVFLCVAFLAAIAFQLSSASVDELKLEIVYKPEDCGRVSKKNDMLTMHYRGTLEDGTEFDSR